MVITEEEVETIFASSTHQAEVVEALYRLAFPDYDRIAKLHGFPEAGERLSKLIWDKFFEFDRQHHPDVMQGGRWMNNGFSTNKNLGDWEVDVSKVKKTMEEDYGRNDHSSRRTIGLEGRTGLNQTARTHR